MNTEETMIAYCGITCTDCAAYIATNADDPAGLEKVAADWSKGLNAELTAADCRCNGCSSEEGPWMSHCDECEIRACAKERQAANCAHCDEYACEKLERFLDSAPEAKETLERIHAGLKADPD